MMTKVKLVGELIGLEEASRVIGMSRSGLRAWITQGRVDGVKVPHRGAQRGYVWGIRRSAINDVKELVSKSPLAGTTYNTRGRPSRVIQRPSTGFAQPRPKVSSELRDVGNRLIRLAARLDGI